jgi:hypothetical protein
MAGDNGQGGNGGKPPANEAGGMGGLPAVVDGLDGRRKRRETLIFLESAVEKGWFHELNLKDDKGEPISPWKLIASITVQVLLRGNDREKIRAASILRLMARDRIQATGLLDHIDRLDQGKSTGNINLTQNEHQTDDLMSDPMINELAQQIEHRRLKLEREGKLPEVPEPDNGGNGHSD